MSLRTSRVYLPFFFLLALISCENPTDIGLNLPGQNQLGTHFETQPALASTVIQPDSILAFKNEPIVVGKVTDGLLGTISATHYTEIGLNGTNISFSPGTTPNAKLELVLGYTGYYYGDTTVSIKLNVFQLSQNFQEDKTYFINDKVLTEPSPIGSITFKPQSHRLNSESRLITIPLDQNLATQLLGRSFATQEDFRNFWRGIAITPDPSSAAGSLVGFTTLPDSAGVSKPKGTAGINLTYTDADGKVQTHNFSFSGAHYFNGIEVTRQGALTALDKPNKELASTQTNNVTYIQANSGVKTRLTFPGLENFKENKGNIFINHAELIIPVKPNSFNAKNPVTPVPQTIFLYEINDNFRIPRTTGGTAFAVQAGNSPAFNITSYVQAIIDKRKVNNGILVTPTAEDQLSARTANLSFPGTLNLRRALIDAADKNIGLRIYYSELK